MEFLLREDEIFYKVFYSELNIIQKKRFLEGGKWTI